MMLSLSSTALATKPPTPTWMGVSCATLIVHGVLSNRKQSPSPFSVSASPSQTLSPPSNALIPFPPLASVSKNGLIYRHCPPTLTNTRQSPSLQQPAPFSLMVNWCSRTWNRRTPGVRLDGVGTSSQPSRMLWAKTVASVPENGRITLRRVGWAGIAGQLVSDWFGGGVAESIRHRRGVTVRHPLVSSPPHACLGSSL